jgi:putative lysine transport system substrate-binding protein
MRRKLTAALLTAAMAISLTACGGSASAGASTGETASVTEAGATTTASGKEVLRVAMSADYAPFDWLQEDDSNGAVMTSNGSYMNGYDVLVAKYIAEKLDMDLEITQIDWDGLILSIQSGKVDCAIAGMSITSERSQSVDFSDPYYNANIVAVVAADGSYADAVNVTDFEGATLTSTLNTVWYDVLDQITDYATKDAALDTFASMVAAVHAGKIDGFTCDMPSAKSILVSNPDLKIIDFEGGTGFEVSNEETDLGIPCQKGNTELVDKINEVLAGLSQEDRDAMMDQAVASQPVSN